MIPQDGLEARFAARMGALLGPEFPAEIALAVSGGGDSMTMLALAHGWARGMGVRLSVVTIDHGLRDGSAAEAAMVAHECAALGHRHAILRWHWDGTGNLQDAARNARLALIDGWRGDVGHVLFAHTRDDQAETLLLRLARGSGVDGLAAMSDRRFVTPAAASRGFWQVRPLLEETRADLRHHADTLRLPYMDDPSNDDPRFDRVRARKALAVLGDLGLDAAALSGTAARMARARAALVARAVSVAPDLLRPGPADGADLVLDRDTLARLERDTQMRLLAAALQWVGGTVYRPRAAALERLLDRALAGAGGTLHGAQLAVGRASIRVFREYRAVREIRGIAGQGTLWDGMWEVGGPAVDGLSLRALGPDGWAQIPDAARDLVPHDAALARPAVFDGPRLVACAALAHGPAHGARLHRLAESFVTFLQFR